MAAVAAALSSPRGSIDLRCASTAQRHIVYELKASAVQLPVVDCSKGIKNVLLSETWLRRCNSWLHHHKRYISAAQFFGGALGASSLYCPASVARGLGVGCMVLSLPGIVAGILVLRADMVRILLRTYEFWYLSVTNAFAMALMAVHLNDLRACSLISAVLGFEITILLDASYRAVSTTTIASVLAALTLFVFMVIALIGVVDEAVNPAFLQYGTRTVSVVDGIVNALTTVIVMLLRNVARKYFVDRQPRHTAAVASVRCITYRCRVRLAIADNSYPAARTNENSKISSVIPQRVVVRDTNTGEQHVVSTTQLQFVPIADVFDSANTLLQWVVKPCFRPLSPLLSRLLHTLHAIGIVCTVLALVLHSSASSSRRSLILPTVSVISTSLFVGVYALHQQRLLSRRLCVSFDFAFVSTQLSVAHLCVCDAFYWDARCLAVLSSWLWVHWVLTLDSITPVMRVRLDYRRWTAWIVLAVFLFAHGVLSLEIIVWNTQGMQDRSVLDTMLWGHRVRVRVIPMLFGRMIPTFCWSLRLLVRLHKRGHDELIVLQGAVMYEDLIRNRKRKQSATTQSSPTLPPVTGDHGSKF